MPGNERDEEPLSRLWLSTLEQLAEHIAHDIRNGLNGAAVNVEVVRSRTARGGEGASVAGYAAAAAAELERVSAQTDALVALARRPGPRTDVGVLVTRFGALLRGAGESRVRIEVRADAGGAESSAPLAARVALGTALLQALERDGPVFCRLGTEAPAAVYIETEAGGPLTLAGDVATTLGTVGITTVPTTNGIAIIFPPAPTG